MTKGLSVVNQKQKLSEWAERVSACRSSGLSVRAWCQANGVSEHTYYRWQRRLYDLAQVEHEGRDSLKSPHSRSQQAASPLACSLAAWN